MTKDVIHRTSSERSYGCVAQHDTSDKLFSMTYLLKGDISIRHLRENMNTLELLPRNIQIKKTHLQKVHTRLWTPYQSEFSPFGSLRNFTYFTDAPSCARTVINR